MAKEAVSKLTIEVIQETTRGVRFKVTEQVTRGNTFGEFRASNGVRLDAFSHPEWDSSGSALWVRGSAVKSDNDALICSLKDFRRIEVAVKEFGGTIVRSGKAGMTVPMKKTPSDRNTAKAEPTKAKTAGSAVETCARVDLAAIRSRLTHRIEEIETNLAAVKDQRLELKRIRALLDTIS